MLQKAHDSPCFLCDTVPSRWNDPGIADHPERASSEMAALSRRAADLESDRTTPAELHHHLLEMCAMCQEVMMDAGEGASKEEVLERLAFRIERLRKEALLAAGRTR